MAKVKLAWLRRTLVAAAWKRLLTPWSLWSSHWSLLGFQPPRSSHWGPRHIVLRENADGHGQNSS
jgi:hypothetical protein